MAETYCLKTARATHLSKVDRGTRARRAPYALPVPLQTFWQAGYEGMIGA
jgi:hypothetical protein